MTAARAKPRYRISQRSGIAHDMRRLTERCNTDQLGITWDRDDVPVRIGRKRIKRCRWCLAPWGG